MIHWCWMAEAATACHRCAADVLPEANSLILRAPKQLAPKQPAHVAELEGIMRCHNPIVAGASLDTRMGGWGPQPKKLGFVQELSLLCPAARRKIEFVFFG